MCVCLCKVSDPRLIFGWVSRHYELTVENFQGTDSLTAASDRLDTGGNTRPEASLTPLSSFVPSLTQYKSKWRGNDASGKA